MSGSGRYVVESDGGGILAEDCDRTYWAPEWWLVVHSESRTVLGAYPVKEQADESAAMANAAVDFLDRENN